MKCAVMKQIDWSCGGLPGFAAIGMYPVCNAYAKEIQDEHWAGKEAHAEGIGHGTDDGRDQKNGEDGVTEVAQQELGVHNAEEGKEEDEDGEFETDAKPEDDGQEEAGVLVDGEDGVELLSEAEDEDLDGAFDDEAVAEPGAAEEESDSSAHERPDVFLFVLVHARRDEEPDLVEDERAGEDSAADERGLEQQVERVGGVLVVEVEGRSEEHT